MRWQDLEQFQQSRGSVYPHKFDVSIEIDDFLNKYGGLAGFIREVKSCDLTSAQWESRGQTRANR
eukprot:763636-Hanusia_phi.AAC.3